MKIKIPKDPYDERVMFTKSTLELNPNTISCLVGANGTGKTTCINFIKSHIHKNSRDLEDEYNPFSKIFEEEKEYENFYISFNKRSKLVKDLMGMEPFLEDAAVAFSSTGEGIVHRLGRYLEALGKWAGDKKNEGKTVFIFFDDCDAGTSIDVIKEIKEVLTVIVEDLKKRNINYYMIITANSFEMCRDLDCISVHDFSHKKFTEYEEFKLFVLESRKLKNKSLKESKDGN